MTGAALVTVTLNEQVSDFWPSDTTTVIAIGPFGTSAQSGLKVSWLPRTVGAFCAAGETERIDQDNGPMQPSSVAFSV